MAGKEHWISARGCVYNTNYHFVWSTKYRRKVLTGKVAEDLHRLHDNIAKKKGVTLVTQEIMPDHGTSFYYHASKICPFKYCKNI